MPGNLLYARGGSLLIIILCAAFSPGKTKESIVVGKESAVRSLGDRLISYLWESLYDEARSYLTAVALCTTRQCQVQKGKERSQPAVWTLFSFLSPRLRFQFRPCALLPVSTFSLDAGPSRAWSCHVGYYRLLRARNNPLSHSNNGIQKNLASGSFISASSSFPSSMSMCSNSGNFLASSIWENRWSMTFDVKRKLFLQIFCHSWG